MYIIYGRFRSDYFCISTWYINFENIKFINNVKSRECPKMKKKNIWLDGIMGVALGDALGLPVQFLSREKLAAKPITDMIGYGTFNLPKGSWSDDTSLTLATLESICRCKCIDCEDIMENFADWLLDGCFTPYGKAFDEGNTCVTAIVNYVKNNDVNKCGVTGEYANGNGALMRIIPVCLYAYENVKAGVITEDEAVEMIHKVSALTHNHLRSKIACGIYYFLVKAIIDEEGDLQARLQTGMDAARKFYMNEVSNLTQLAYYGRMADLEGFKAIPRGEIRSSGYVVDSLEAAVWSLINTNSLEEALIKAVNLGEDTDTVAAITGGLGGLYYGYESVRESWRADVVKGEEIRGYLVKEYELE